MSYVLGGTTLPNPHGFSRESIESSTSHESISGVLSKDIKNRKERFILTYRFLTQSQVTAITDAFNQLTTLTFSMSDGDLTIGSTTVHVDLKRRSYNTKGTEYREDLDVILTERS